VKKTWQMFFIPAQNTFRRRYRQQLPQGKMKDEEKEK
jgi:hypothetical protein